MSQNFKYFGGDQTSKSRKGAENMTENEARQRMVESEEWNKTIEGLAKETSIVIITNI